MDAAGISAIIFGVLLTVVAVLYGHNLLTGTSTGSTMGNLEFFGNLVAYLPNTLLAYGFIADLVNWKYQYSIASITAILGMVVNKYIGSPLINVTATAIRNRLSKQDDTLKKLGESLNDPLKNAQTGGALPCDVPGFEWLTSEVAPQSIVMSMTILWYILIQSWDTGQSSQTIGLGVATAIIFFLQVGLIRSGDCKFGKWSFLIALIMGISIAGVSYGVQKLLPQSSNSPTPAGPNATYSPGNTIKCPNGYVFNKAKQACVHVNEKVISVGDPAGQSQPVDDNDQFVCEGYKDGELITSTIVE